MTYVYLVASLPLLNLGDDVPMTADAFRFQCMGVLSAGDLEELDLILAGRAGDGASVFARRWHGAESQLRNAAARRRAGAAGIDPRAFLRSHPGYDVSIDRAVEDAFGKSNPLERERVLDQCRWRILDELAWEDAYGAGSVFAFAVKLQVAAKWAGLRDEDGQARFREIINENLRDRGVLLELEVDVLS